MLKRKKGAATAIQVCSMLTKEELYGKVSKVTVIFRPQTLGLQVMRLGKTQRWLLVIVLVKIFQSSGDALLRGGGELIRIGRDHLTSVCSRCCAIALADMREASLNRWIFRIGFVVRHLESFTKLSRRSLR